MFNFFKDKDLIPYSDDYLVSHLSESGYKTVTEMYHYARGAYLIPKSDTLSHLLEDGYKLGKGEFEFIDTDDTIYHLTNDYVWRNVDRVALEKSYPGVTIRVMSGSTMIIEDEVSKKWGVNKIELTSGYTINTSTINVSGQSRSGLTYQMRNKDYASLTKSEDLYFDMYPVSQLCDNQKYKIPEVWMILRGNQYYIDKQIFKSINKEGRFMKHDIHTVSVGMEVIVSVSDKNGLARVERVTGTTGSIHLSNGLVLKIKEIRAGGYFYVNDEPVKISRKLK